MSTADTDILSRSVSAFARHTMRREFGWSWLVRAPETTNYLFRVTFAKGALMLSGDLGTLVVSHYSFSDPWSAAAWVNGANFDYFMEKTEVKEQYDEQATVEGIIEDAYRSLRDGDGTKHFKRIMKAGYGGGDPDSPEDRKDACRALRDGSVTADEAYEITGDCECLRMTYCAHCTWQYAAFRLWAAKMWETEPVWHKALRLWRRVRADVAALRHQDLIWSPTLYAQFDHRGRMVYVNGAYLWTWKRRPGNYRYAAVYPVRAFGINWARFGLWRMGGSSMPDAVAHPDSTWRDQRYTDRFTDIRPGMLKQPAWRVA